MSLVTLQLPSWPILIQTLEPAQLKGYHYLNIDLGTFDPQSMWESGRDVHAQCNNSIPMGHGICLANSNCHEAAGNPAKEHGAQSVMYRQHGTSTQLRGTSGRNDGTEVIQILRDKNKFLSARNGDHLMCPFQCGICHFRNLKVRDPLRQDYMD